MRMESERQGPCSIDLKCWFSWYSLWAFGKRRGRQWWSRGHIAVGTVLNIHWKDSCWSWSSNTLATWFKELTHWKRPWWWERLKAGGEGDNRGWDGWIASLTQWTWVWASSGSWWWTGKPGVLRSVGSQRVRQDWVTELNRKSEITMCYKIAHP